MPNKKPFKAVATVSDVHAKKFVEALYESWTSTGILAEAMTLSGVMEWPDTDECGCDVRSPVVACAHQEAFTSTQDRIAERLERDLRVMLRNAFRAAATDVLRATGAPS